MLALVDGVPRTLQPRRSSSGTTSTHQIEVIVRRTAYRLRKAEERAHILRGLRQGARPARRGHRPDPRAAESADAARGGLMELLDIDEIQATAILDMQLRRLAALERQRIIDELAEIEAEIADLKDILATPERQRQIIRDELAEIVDKYGDDRRTQIIAVRRRRVRWRTSSRDEDVVVTITRTGYAKRTKTDLYRVAAARRQGRAGRGAASRTTSSSHFFVCSTHDWILFFTNKGRVYRAKAYELPEANRDRPGQHVANLLAFQPDEQIAQVIADPELRGRAVPGAGHQEAGW